MHIARRLLYETFRVFCAPKAVGSMNMESDVAKQSYQQKGSTLFLSEAPSSLCGQVPRGRGLWSLYFGIHSFREPHFAEIGIFKILLDP